MGRIAKTAYSLIPSLCQLSEGEEGGVNGICLQEKREEKSGVPLENRRTVKSTFCDIFIETLALMITVKKSDASRDTGDKYYTSHFT